MFCEQRRVRTSSVHALGIYRSTKASARSPSCNINVAGTRLDGFPSNGPSNTTKLPSRRGSPLPSTETLALLASLLVYSEGGREGAGCVWVSTCQRQLMFLRRPRHVLNASSTRIDPLAIDCATPRNQRNPTPSEPLRHTPTLWENHLPRSRSDLGAETTERVLGARPCSLVLVLTRITCLAASCSVRGRMRGNQAHGR